MPSNILLEAADALLLETGGTDNLLLEIDDVANTEGGEFPAAELAPVREIRTVAI